MTAIIIIIFCALILLYLIKKLSDNFIYPIWFILFTALSFITFISVSNIFFETSGVRPDALSYCVVLAVIFIYFPIIGLLGFIYKKYEERLYKKQLYSTVKEHFDILSKKYNELVHTDDYGAKIYDKWYSEIDRFNESIVRKQKARFQLSDDDLRKLIIEIFDKQSNS